MTGTLIAAYSTPLFIALATLSVNHLVQRMPLWFRVCIVVSIILLAGSVSLSFALSRNDEVGGTFEAIYAMASFILATATIAYASIMLILGGADEEKKLRRMSDD